MQVKKPSTIKVLTFISVLHLVKRTVGHNLQYESYDYETTLSMTNNRKLTHTYCITKAKGYTGQEQNHPPSKF